MWLHVGWRLDADHCSKRHGQQKGKHLGVVLEALASGRTTAWRHRQIGAGSQCRRRTSRRLGYCCSGSIAGPGTRACTWSCPSSGAGTIGARSASTGVARRVAGVSRVGLRSRHVSRYSVPSEPCVRLSHSCHSFGAGGQRLDSEMLPPPASAHVLRNDNWHKPVCQRYVSEHAIVQTHS